VYRQLGEAFEAAVAGLSRRGRRAALWGRGGLPARPTPAGRMTGSAREQLELSVAFWESIIRAPEATDWERMKAQAQLDRLFGLTRRQLRLRLGDLLAWKEKAAARG
jgi:hypothetical protein